MWGSFAYRRRSAVDGTAAGSVGRSTAGLRSKKLNGRSLNECHSVGITGRSSVRHEVMQADVGPHHEILLADRPILLDPRGQPGAIARIAEGIVARRVAFRRIVTRHPEVVVEEPRPPGGPFVGVEHLVAVVPVQQLVAHPVADGVGDVLVHDHQLLDAMAAIHDRLLFGVRRSERHDV
jgi:hypothetical protein